jgi:hypothetical protein
MLEDTAGLFDIDTVASKLLFTTSAIQLEVLVH